MIISSVDNLIEDVIDRFHPVTHIIFDFDGLLVDTETVYTRATNAVLETFGKTFTWEHKAKVLGLAPRDSCQLIVDLFDLPMHLDEFIAQQDDHIYRLLPEAKLMPGAEKLIKHFHEHSIPMAIATGSSSKAFAVKTAHFGDLFVTGKYFKHIVTIVDDHEIKRGKPAPDAFEICAARFAVPPASPKNVLVFEDSPPGVIGALAAGMQTVFVPDPMLPHSQGAHVILESLLHFEPLHFNLPNFKY